MKDARRTVGFSLRPLNRFSIGVTRRATHKKLLQLNKLGTFQCYQLILQGLQAQSWIFDLLITGWKSAIFYNLRPVFKSLRKHNSHGDISEVIRWPGSCKIKDGPKTLNFNFQVSSKSQILNIIFSWIIFGKMTYQWLLMNERIVKLSLMIK